MFPTILVVDDEPSILQTLSGLLIDEGFEVQTGQNGYEALKRIESDPPDLVLLDIWMPGIDGIETLKEIRKDHPHLPVIIITGHGSIETAVRATKLGAYDLIEKPLSIDRVIVAINNALNFRRLEEENRYLRKKMLEKNSIDGDSPITRHLRETVMKAAPTDAWIFISGEHGTGKELVARLIHMLSLRSEYPLIDVNCAAIPEDLIESDLFGHERGASEGAPSKKVGKFELATGGTLFLDEIGDMSLKMQSKILRVLEAGQIQRLGGSRMIDIDVRVVAASNKNLEVEIRQGRFREDLFYRLNVFPIFVPPLRDRLEDIPVLAETFLEEFAENDRGRKKEITPAALKVLGQYHWPGNVRELKNLIERLTIMVEKDIIALEDIPPAYMAAPANEDSALEIDNFKEAKRAFETAFLKKKLAAHGDNITRTAETIGVGRSYLSKRMKTLKI
jgi:two-component system nitrogen regulation response regulator NtrX